MRSVLNCISSPDMDGASSPIKRNLKRAYSECRDAVDDLSHRNKLIRLADMSEAGWAAVDEYEQHALASDSDDEKRIVRAENRALKKQRDQRRKRQDKISASRRQSPQRWQPQPHIFNTQRKPGVCFACGKPGHWKNECLVAKQLEQGMSSATRSSQPVERPSKISNYNVFVPVKHIVSSIVCNPINNPIDQCSDVSKTGVIDSVLNIDMNKSGILYASSIIKQCSVISPLGRLKSSLSKWKYSGANTQLLNVIENGYRLPLIKLPSNTALKNNLSAK